MKILLDEQVNKIIKFALIADFQIFRLRDLGWLGYQNGVLRENSTKMNLLFLLLLIKICPSNRISVK